MHPFAETAPCVDCPARGLTALRTAPAVAGKTQTGSGGGKPMGPQGIAQGRPVRIAFNAVLKQEFGLLVTRPFEPVACFMIFGCVLVCMARPLSATAQSRVTPYRCGQST